MMKKLLTLAAACVLLLCAFPMSASAKPIPVAQVGDATFNTLTEAVQVANQYPGSTIEILSDATFGTTMLTFEDVTINLNGHTITRLNKEARWYVGGIEEPETTGGTAPEKLPVIVINGGKNGSLITDAEDAPGAISTPLITAQYADIVLNNLTMINTTFDEDASAFCLRDGSNATLNNCNLTSSCGIKVYREVGTAPSTLIINGGTYTAASTKDTNYVGSAILVQLTCQYDISIVINDAVLTSENTTALTVSSKSHVVLNNSTLNGHTGIYLKSGDIVLNNTTVTAAGDYLESPATGNIKVTTSADPVLDGSGIEIDSNSTYTDPVIVAVSADSSISSANSYGIREVGGLSGTGVTLVDVQAEADAQISGALGDVALLPAAE